MKTAPHGFVALVSGAAWLLAGPQDYEGDHWNHLRDRIEQKALPFFSEHPAFSQKKK